MPRAWQGTHPSLNSPDSTWGRRILFLAAEARSLAVTSAYASTLGGGYFMCRFVDKAQDMARAQLSLAVQLGDEVLQSKCRTHLIYSDIQLGDFDVAREKLERERNVARNLRDRELCSVIESAIHFCEQSRKLNATLAPVEFRSDAAGDVQDEFYRMRVVKLPSRRL